MSAEDHVDRFQVVNGPEDGTDFHIARTPADLGSDPGCAVYLRLDQDVRRFHARITVAPDGYRIRSKSNAGVRVNGRKTGSLRSRIMRNGDILRAGQTELCLRCAPEGLASRTRGMDTESDLVWTLRRSFRWLLLGGRILRRSLFGILRHPFWLAILLLAAWAAFTFYRYHTLMPMYDTAQHLFTWARYYIGQLFRN
jgi:hypothetical protein